MITDLLKRLFPPKEIILGWVVTIEEDVSICDVEVAGTILPTEFPTKIIRFWNMREGDRFIWWARPSGKVKYLDITPFKFRR